MRAFVVRVICTPSRKCVVMGGYRPRRRTIRWGFKLHGLAQQGERAARTSAMRPFPLVCAVLLVGLGIILFLTHNAHRTPAWLEERGRQENTLLAGSRIDHDFHFSNQLSQTGIAFANRIVDDAGKTYKLVHYDHGSGVCAADVDGDSRPDLYFLTQLGTNQLWSNTGDDKFVDVTRNAGVSMPDQIAVGCAFADIDNDGDADLFVTTVRHGNHLFENLGTGTFRDITAAAGVGYSGHSSGAVFFDYDRDGRLDLLVTNVGVFTSNTRGPGGYYLGLDDALLGHLHPERAEASILYHNLGGDRFEDVTRTVGLVDLSWSGDATPLDVNDDGFPDLYMLDMQGTDHLWLNEGGKHFRDATTTYFPRTPWGSMGAKVFDYNGDGRLDLFLTSMHPDMWVDLRPGDWAAEARKDDPNQMPPQLIPGGIRNLIFGNAMFASRGNGQFDDVSDSIGVETYWPWGPSVDDFNADGWDDIFIAAGMNFPFRYGVNSLLLNEQGHRYLPSEFVLGVEPRPHGATEQVWFTLDCNGADRGNRLCGKSVHPKAMVIECLSAGGGRVNVTGTLASRSAVTLDLDGDGDVDIVTNEFNARPQVLMSDLAQRRRINYLEIRLRGTRSNREGLGARVTVVLPDGRRLLKVLDGKSGYLSQSDLPLYFGLGEADTVPELDIRWPSGEHQTLSGPKAGQTIDVVEP